MTRRLLRLLSRAATAASLILFAFAAVFAFVGTQQPGVYPIRPGARATFFIACEPTRLRLVLQHASTPTDSTFTPDTSTLDTIRVTRTTTTTQEMAGFRSQSLPTPSDFEWNHHQSGWELPPGSSGSLGAPRPSSIFRFTHTSASVPYWFALFATAALPLLRLITSSLARHRRPENAPLHPCPNCGYDLRATPTRCPECGRTMSPAVE